MLSEKNAIDALPIIMDSHLVVDVVPVTAVKPRRAPNVMITLGNVDVDLEQPVETANVVLLDSGIMDPVDVNPATVILNFPSALVVTRSLASALAYLA